MGKTVTRTLRLDQEIDDAITKIAASEGVSVNFLANRSLRKFVEWDMLAAEFGFVTLPKWLLDWITKDRDADTFENWGRDQARLGAKIASQYRASGFSVPLVLEFLRKTATYNGRYSIEDKTEDGNIVLVLRHDTGLSWSRFYYGMLDESFRVILKLDVSITFTDSLCVVKLPAEH